MNTGVGRARIGQWYTRWDKGENFQVVGYDDDSRTVEIQTFDGDLDEVDVATWAGLPLTLAEPPEDWTGPVDDVERDDLGYSETDMSAADWAEPLQTLRADERAEKASPGSTEGDARGLESEATGVRDLDHPVAAGRRG
jgi:Family of unknown function (DUF6763)